MSRHVNPADVFLQLPLPRSVSIHRSCLVYVDLSGTLMENQAELHKLPLYIHVIWLYFLVCCVCVCGRWSPPSSDCVGELWEQLVWLVSQWQMDAVMMRSFTWRASTSTAAKVCTMGMSLTQTTVCTWHSAYELVHMSSYRGEEIPPPSGRPMAKAKETIEGLSLILSYILCCYSGVYMTQP